ncbi:RHS repeat-associated core domain-containing protein [Pseudomonas sp. TE12234]
MPATRATLLCHYRYDALDRLTGQGLTNAPPLQRFYCKSRLTTEIQGALRQTLFQQGDWLLAQQTQQGVEYDTALLATDQQRSVLHTLKTNQAQPIAYAPYGHRRFISGWLSLMGFNGERPDPLTGHYLLGNGYRAFNPVLMRFNSPDSLSPFGKGGLNTYAYCLGDPANKNDPTGHFSAAINKMLSTWLHRARDRISVSFARSLGSSSSVQPASNLNALGSSHPIANQTTLAPEPLYQPPSLVQESLKAINKRGIGSSLNEIAAPISLRVEKLNNAEGQKIAARLFESEPNNVLLKLAATNQLQGGADWAENLTAYSKNHKEIIRSLGVYTAPNMSAKEIFEVLRLAKFFRNREVIYRQRHLNLVGR